MTDRFVVAPDSFKGTMSSSEAGAALAAGIRAAGASADIVPVADGGEGTLDALAPALGATTRTAIVTGPDGAPIRARYAVDPVSATGIVELAEASGLTRRTDPPANPGATTTYGTGELIARAIADGARTVIVGLGGSATVDGGAGLAQALGTIFRDADGGVLPAPIRGDDLRRIAAIEPARLPVRLRIAADVDNPLCGAAGAAAVYGPQKGATPRQVRDLDAGLAHLAETVGADPDRPFLGAAGGAAFGLLHLLVTEAPSPPVPGAALVLERVGLAGRCAGAAALVTGEGRLDAQSMHGKLLMHVASIGRSAGTPVVAVVGSADPDIARRLAAGPDALLRAVIDLTAEYGAERARRDTRTVLADVGRRLASASSNP